MILNSALFYGWSGEAKPVSIGEGDDKKQVVAHQDFLAAMRSSEEAMGQKILQDNNEVIRVGALISDQSLSALNTGTATAADCAAQLNKLYNIMSQLVILGKNNG